MKTTLDHSFRRGGQQQAFTRTDLLALVAVLGLLGCLVLPAFPHSKAHTRRAACVNNLRQLATSLDLYAGEFQQYPISVEWEALAIANYAGRLRPHLARNPDVLVCPERVEEVESTPGAFTPLELFSYGYNGAGTAPDGRDLELGMGLSRRIAACRIKFPSEMIVLGDSGASGLCGPQLSPNEIEGLKESEVGQPQMPSNRHNGGANILFCDGHVVYGKQEKWTEKTPEVRRQWNNDNQPHREMW
jgi:prepilin-type processing-associated H-X9-DG protein